MSAVPKLFLSTQQNTNTKYKWKINDYNVENYVKMEIKSKYLE